MRRKKWLVLLNIVERVCIVRVEMYLLDLGSKVVLMILVRMVWVEIKISEVDKGVYEKWEKG